MTDEGIKQELLTAIPSPTIAREYGELIVGCARRFFSDDDAQNQRALVEHLGRLIHEVQKIEAQKL